MKKISIIALLSVLLCTACYDLNIAPKNQITDDDLLTNESGMDIYLARLYSEMPWEDFKYMASWGVTYNSWLGAFGIEGTGEALNRDGICTSYTGEDDAYWSAAYRTLRYTNHLLETLPEYRDNFSEVLYNQYMGEAYFIRAYIFYKMAQRYGGIPLVTWEIQYPDDADALEVPRSTEEQTWDQVLADFDMAIELLMPEIPVTMQGHVYKYAALAFKSEAMLYAGSVAKYNEVVSGRLTGFGRKTGVRVIGFDAATAKEASLRYFREAYLAAREVMNSGQYELYRNKWIAGDAEAQYQNMVDMFSDISSANRENILVREYTYPTLTHGIDAYSSPYIFRAPLSSGTCVTLDFLELFDGFDRYSDGTVKVTTGNTNTQGEYLLYDKPMDFFADAEPRLRAYVIFPGDVFKNQEIEIRMGVYTGNEPIQPLFSDYSYANATTQYQHSTAYANGELVLSPGPETQQTVTLADGTTIYAAGANGPFYDTGESAMTGLLFRKWLNPDPSASIGEGMSEQPYILIRYADVLLNAAEAAVELALEGQSSPDGSNLLQVATDAINDIRNRAGAVELTGTLTATETGRNIVRKERRKELAFEHKTKWDLRRWRVMHYENREGFWGEERDKTFFSNERNFRFRGLYPFISAQTGKYFFDAHFQAVSMKTFSYNTVDYYFAVPGGEVTKSSVIDQQPNR